MLDWHFSKLTQFKTFFPLIISQRSQGEQATRLRTWPRWRGVGVSLDQDQAPLSVLLQVRARWGWLHAWWWHSSGPRGMVQVARPGGPGAQSLPRHPGVTFGGHWTWTQRSRGRLQTAPADDRQVATGRNYNYTQKKLQIMGKSNLWRAGPTQQPAPSLLCLCERLMGQFFKISAREQSSAYCLCWCWNSTFSPSKHFCANLNYVTFFPVFSAVPWCFFAGLKYLRIGLGLD